MSLFGDLPSAKHGDGQDSGGMLGSQFQPFRKRAMLAPTSILRSKKQARDSQAGPVERTSSDSAAAVQPAPSFSAYSIFSAFGPIEDEYDPARPNDYEKVKEETERRRLHAEAEAQRQAELKEQEERERFRRENDQQDERGEGATPGLGAGGPGPGLDGEGAGGSGAKMSVAMKLLQRMGWKEGEGLGKNRQGIATPIIHQKTDKRTGIIVAAEPLNAKPRQGVVLQGTPSKVVLLRNMVAPGEVDDALEDEVAEELSKYGQVQRVLIFEVTEPNFPAHQAVRIFVELDRIESATKAVVALQGRFFGGKTLSASFFSEDRFLRRELAPLPEEL